MAFSLPDLMDVVHKHNRNPTPKPMPVDEVDRLRVRKYRDPQNSETVALPESLKALLAYDCQLTSPTVNWYWNGFWTPLMNMASCFPTRWMKMLII
jgi:hypothetical protein